MSLAWGWLLLALSLAAPLPAAAALAARCAAEGAAQRWAALAGWWLMLAPLPAVVLGWAGMLAGGPLLAAHAVLALAGLALCRPGTRDVHRQAWGSLRAAAAEPAVRVALAAAAALAAVLPAALAVLPTSDWDTYMYQLPVAAEWLRSGGFDGVPAAWAQAGGVMGGIRWSPGGWNALVAQALALGGHERLALVPNLGALAALALATAALARSCGATRAAAAGAALIAAALPLAHENLHSAHIDLPFAAAVAVGLAAALAAGRSGCPGWSALAVAAAAAALAIKQSGMWTAPLLLAVLAAALAAGGSWRAALAGLWRRPWWTALALGLLALALGWYLRNWLATGNPTGFVRLRLFGQVLPGLIDPAFLAPTSLANTFDPRRWGHWLLVGGAVGFYAGPVVLAWLAAAWTRARPAGGRRERWLLGAAAAALAWLYWSGPWSARQPWDADMDWWLAQQLRYCLALWAVLAALAAAWAGGRALALIGACAALAAPWWWPPPCSAAPLAGGAIAALLLLALAPGRWRLLVAPLALAGALVLPPATNAWRQRQRDRLFAYHGAASALDALPAGAAVALWACHQPWLAYGQDGRRPVLHLDLERCAGPAGVLAAVRACPARWLVIGDTWPPCDRGPALTLAAHPKAARLVHGNPAGWGLTLWELRPADPDRRFDR